MNIIRLLRGLRQNLKRGSLRWRFNVNFIGHLDYSYGTIWDKSDAEYIKHEYNLVRMGRFGGGLIWSKLDRYWHDQTVYFERFSRRFEPQQIAFCLDQITDDAIGWMVDMHTDRTTETPRYISVGTSTQTPDRTDHTLVAEVDRRHILNNGGYIDPLGHNELYGMLFPFAMADIDCSEAGLHLHDDPTDPTDIMICRNKFSPVLEHDINQNALGINICIQNRAF